MSINKLHEDEIEISASLVSRLIAKQFPQWADLPIKRFNSSGTENAIYRLGNNMSIRLPRVKGAKEQIEKEHRFLPKFAPLLPLRIPTPIAKGVPSEDYSSHWSIYPWIEGEAATIENLANPKDAAMKLAQFITALQKIGPIDGPLPGKHNFFRGVNLLERDEETQSAIKLLHGLIDTKAAEIEWKKALQTAVWHRSPVWIHGDLLPGNLLVNQGELTAVIDFGGLGIGDPACDLITAWCLFSAEDREFFRKSLKIDDATWARGRGWALSIGVIGLPYYRLSNPVFAKNAEHMIKEALVS